MSHFIYQLKRVKARELIQIWKLPIALICAFFYRLWHRDLWIICEDKNEARDNGYWLFKYLREEHPEQECVYAISSVSPDIDKIKELGRWVEFGTLSHWILYLASTKKISSQKAGNPNAAIFYFLEVYGLLKDKRVFLQHGVIKDDLKWLYYNVTKMDRFICGAYPEYEYVKEKYGYPKGNVCYTGLCRFDEWHNIVRPEQTMILIMPTWREWIADEDFRLVEFEGTKEIPQTNYFKTWIAFITDARIKKIAEMYKVEFVFYPHRNMQKYMSFFPKSTQYLKILSAENCDIKDLLKNASMMITDYSSVFFDILYMKKPVIYYQFDYEKFRAGQYAEGYFNYRNNPFGNSYDNSESVFCAIEEYIKSNFKVSDKYVEAHREYFKLYDNNNCKRVYEVTKDL